LTKLNSTALNLMSKISVEEDKKKTSLDQVIVKVYINDVFANEILKLLHDEAT